MCAQCQEDLEGDRTWMGMSSEMMNMPIVLIAVLVHEYIHELK